MLLHFCDHRVDQHRHTAECSTAYDVVYRRPCRLQTHRKCSFDLQFGWNFIFQLTAIDVPVPREPLWIVMLWGRQRALHVKARVHKLEISISCFHNQLQQSKSPFLSPMARFLARFRHGPCAIPGHVCAEQRPLPCSVSRNVLL